MTKTNKGFVCTDCFKLKKCRDFAVSWALFFIALVATISVRAVNVVLDFSQLWAKAFWYIGIGGFFIFFIYKYKYDNLLQKEIAAAGLTDKLLEKKELTGHDYEILGTIICKLSSKKDKVNYFFIFFTSGVALIWAVIVDFILK